MPGTRAVDSVPFGPLTVTELPSCFTSTPFGSEIGFLPMRNMRRSLPDLTEHFAADALLGGIGAGENALRRGDDGETETAEDAGNLVLGAVDAAARARDALDAVNDRLAIVGVAEVDAQRGLRPFLDHFVVADETLVLEDARHLDFELRCGKLDTFVARCDAVADSRKHVRDGIGHRHSNAPGCLSAGLTSSPWSRRGCIRRARADGSRFGKAETCAGTHGGGRTLCSGSLCAT